MTTPGQERPPRIQRLLEQGRLREEEFELTQVATVWNKAVESARDSEVPELSLDGALRAAYDAGQMACLALLTAHGLRPVGGHGHHEVAFAAAQIIGGPDLQDLIVDSEEIRGLRRASRYDPIIAEEGDRDHAIRWAKRTLPTLRAAIIRADSELENRLKADP